MVPVLNQEPAFDEWKYHPFDLEECEDLENYEPDGFHPVHLGDVFGGRYRVVHKLGFGGFSTVWLARDALKNCWVALKIVAARESATCEARFTTTSSNLNIAGFRLFDLLSRVFPYDPGSRATAEELVAQPLVCAARIGRVGAYRIR
jgi:hypothetical protein